MRYICKICNEEKDILEFLKEKKNGEYKYTVCKVCGYLKRHKDMVVKENWNINEYRIIIHNLLSNKVDCINELIPLLNNKTLNDLCILLSENLKIGNVKIQIKSKCSCCNKDIYIKIYQYFSNNLNFCSYKCNGKYYGKLKAEKISKYTRVCQNKNCNKEFEVSFNRVKLNKDKYCCAKCSQEAQTNKIEIKCDFCGNPKFITPSQFKKSKKHFCSYKCSNKYVKEYNKNQKWELRICEICTTEFECKKVSSQRFCSHKCQSQWQSQTLVGENANNFNKDYSIEDRTIECEWCQTNFTVKPYEIGKSRFCSNTCRQAWYANVYSQTEEWKEQSKINAIRILENGLISKTNTKPQKIINEILDDLNINYINEKGFNYCAVDNYLVDYNLIIEVMGTYWHVDNRFYPKINYEIQVNRIKMDKIKNKNLLKDYNINVLYLWEYDIINNKELCKKLIKEYINNDGILSNYHSFNYNDMLLLNKDIIIPYMEWDIKELHNIIDLTVKEKMSKKQQDKWIKFNCEVCGKEKEELISHYNKKEHHFCSRECSGTKKQELVKVNCMYCNKEKYVKINDYQNNKTKLFYCSRECKHDYAIKCIKNFYTIEGSYIMFNCENCNKQHKKLIRDFKKSKHHFCSSSCNYEFKKKNK